MSRITDIRDAAAASEGKLTGALLQCLILGDELDYQPLKDWANMELSGYKTIDMLPDYRVARSSLRGTLIEPRMHTSGYTIPETWIEERFREKAQTIYVVDGIGKLLTLPDDGSLGQTPGGGDLIEGLINNYIQEVYNPWSGVRNVMLSIPPGTFAGVLESVRHRLVQFMIEMNRMFPSDDTIEGRSGEQLHQVDEAFKGIVYIGNAEHVVLANSIGAVDQSTNITTHVSVGNFRSLAEYLQAIDLSDESITELEPLVKEIADGNQSEEAKQSLKDWIGEQVAEIPEAAGEIAADSARRALTESIVKGIKEFAPRAADWLSNIDIPFDSMPM